MNYRWALCAVVALTALIAFGDLTLALLLRDAPAIQYEAARAPALCNWLFEQQGPISSAKLIASTLMLLWWLAAMIRPARRPNLRLANATFSGWLALQTVAVWAAVLGVLYQVAGFADGLTASNTLRIITGTSLSWLIPLTLCVPALQLALGEFAYRSGWSSAQPVKDRSTSRVEAA